MGVGGDVQGRGAHNPAYPKNREGLRTPGVPGPPLPSPPTDDPPFPGAGDRVTYDSRKIRCHGDDPTVSTVPRFVEGGNY